VDRVGVSYLHGMGWMDRGMDGVRCTINRACDGSHGCCIELKLFSL
jgi:hypothetical protein